MMSRLAITFWVATLAPQFAAASILSDRMRANPMRQIISMLQDMQHEVEREGEVEKKTFDKALCACDGGEKNLQGVIAEASTSMEEWTAKTKAMAAESAQLSQEVVEHKAAKAGADRDLEEATELRKKENKKFNEVEKSTKLNVKQLGDAISALEQGMGGAALVQISNGGRFKRMIEVTKFLSSEARSGVLAFLDQGAHDGEASGADVQAPSSGEVLGMLKTMKEDMAADLLDVQAQEKHDAEAFNDMKASKLTESDLAAKAVVEKEKRIGSLAVELSEGKHALADAEKEFANGQTFLANMAEECEKKKKERDLRAKMRTQEVAAVSEAIDILNSDDALETFSKSSPSASLLQQPRKTFDAFLQISQATRASSLLAKQSKRESVEPTDIAQKLVSHMIDGMVSVLHDEDVTDEQKKSWCSNETQLTEQLHAEKKARLQKTTNEITDQTDQIDTLVSDIKGLMAKIAQVDSMVHEMTETRKKEHQEFVDSYATSVTAVRLITKAIKRLEKFYSPAKYAAEKKATEEAALAKAGMSLLQGKGTWVSPVEAKRQEDVLLPGGFDAFVQVASASHRQMVFQTRNRQSVKPVDVPETPKTYEKKESGGVIGLMTDFQTELKTDMAEGETEEKLNTKEYVRVMADAQTSRAQDVRSMNEKKKAKATLDAKLVQSQELKVSLEAEEHNMELYLVQLNTECGFLMQNFEARHEGRVEQEAGLESTLSIVTKEEPPTIPEVAAQYDEEHTKADVDAHFEAQ